MIGLEFADGWWRGNLGFQDKRNTYGNRTAVIAQLEMTDDGGSSHRDWHRQRRGWRGGSPVLAADLYDGETFDARLRSRGWAETGAETGCGPRLAAARRRS